jgi:hypothetical protein
VRPRSRSPARYSKQRTSRKPSQPFVTGTVAMACLFALVVALVPVAEAGPVAAVDALCHILHGTMAAGDLAVRHLWLSLTNSLWSAGPTLWNLGARLAHVDLAAWDPAAHSEHVMRCILAYAIGMPAVLAARHGWVLHQVPYPDDDERTPPLQAREAPFDIEGDSTLIAADDSCAKGVAERVPPRAALVQVLLRPPSGASSVFDLPADTTVAALHRQCMGIVQPRTQPSAANVEMFLETTWLSAGGRPLPADKTLAECGFGNVTTISLSGRVRGGMTAEEASSDEESSASKASSAEESSASKSSAAASLEPMPREAVGGTPDAGSVATEPAPAALIPV